MLDTTYPGGLGNNLFQYSFARMQAEDNGQSYCMTLPGAGVITSVDTHRVSKDSAPFTIVTEREHDRSWKPPVLAPNANILYDGYFQRWEFFEGKRDRVRSYFNLPSTNITDPKDVCIHLRLTDYHSIPTLVKDPKVYGKVIDEVYDGRLCIVTDDSSDPYLNYFKNRYANVTVLSGSSREDFAHLLSYDTIIACNSTFSWWAAYLGNASKIYVPIDFGRGSAAVDLHKLGVGF